MTSTETKHVPVQKLHERSEQFEHLSRVESAFFILQVTHLHVFFAASKCHGFSENVLSRVIAKVFAGTEKLTSSRISYHHDALDARIKALNINGHYKNYKAMGTKGSFTPFVLHEQKA